MSVKTITGIGLIVLLITIVYGCTLLSTSGNRPVAPLDDAYIHFQYARQIARGHPWQYNDGDPRSTGATSPLYPFLLAAGYLLGFGGEHLVWFALGLGIASMAISAWLIYRIAERLVKLTQETGGTLAHWAPAGSAVFFLFTGAIHWTFLSGMESGLFTVFILATLDSYLAQCGSPGSRSLHYPAFWIALAALTRPEGLVLAGVLWLVVVGQSYHHFQAEPRRNRIRHVAKDTYPVTLAVIVGLLPFSLNLALTGSAVATGAQAKSWLGNVPFRFWDILRSILANYRRILEQFAVGLLTGRSWFLAPGLLLLAGMGCLALLQRRRWGIVALTAGWFTVGTFATASLITATWQAGRYQAPFLALLIPLACVGFVALVGVLPQRWQKLAASFIGLSLILATAISFFQARSLYQQAIHTVTRQHLAIADWIRENLPPDTRVGVHDTGAIRYIGQRPTYDMIGLTTQGAATAWRHGAGAVFERMEHSPARPDAFATYPDVFSLPYLAATGLFESELFRAEVVDFALASAGPVQAVFRADWHLAGRDKSLYQVDTLRRTEGLVIVDRLDLADLEDETAHQLTFWENAVRPGFPTEVQQFSYRTDPTVEVLDGGRLVNGGLSFRVTAQPYRPMLLIARLHPFQAGATRVIVDGFDLGLWRYPALPGEWLETTFFVPAEAVTRDEVEIRLEVDSATTLAGHFAPYHFWIWQGEPTTPFPKPGNSLSARLGKAVELVGYDLSSPGESFQPGETVPLVLYWRAAVRPNQDAKVFVHLYDQGGEIVTQEDHRPYFGTRPLYTWSINEVLDDPYTLTLPPDLPPGRYTVAVGMYDATTGLRLSVDVDSKHRLPDERILLQTVNVVAETE